MKKKDLEFFRNLLTQWLQQLLDHAEDTVEGLLESQQHMADPLDRASAESDTLTALRIRDRESKLIKKIRRSLEDIENGDYGICEDCGEDISIERLEGQTRHIFLHSLQNQTRIPGITDWNMMLAGC